MLMLLLLAPASLGAEGFDGHHFKPVPTLGGPLELVGTWRPSDAPASALALSGLLERSEGSLVEVVQDWDGTRERALLDDLVTLNLGLIAAAGPRVALTAALPLHLASEGLAGAEGFTAGDLRLAAPVGLVVPWGGGFGLSVVPFVDLPTGDEARLLGGAGPGAGGLVAAGLHGARVTVDANLGYGHTAEIAWQNQPGGGQLLASGGAAVAAGQALGVRLEALYARSLIEPEVAGTASPGEILLSLGGVAPAKLRWTVGGAAGFTHGAGAAAWRAYGGVSYALVEDPRRDSDGDGLIDSADACLRDPETRNGWRDDDGCPDALSAWTLALVNDDGQPVTGATLIVGQRSLLSDGDGLVHLEGLRPESPLTGTVRAEGYLTGAFSTPPLPEGESRQTLRVAWLPGTTRLTVVDPDGAPLPALVRLSGPGVNTARTLDGAGPTQVQLAPGHWQLEISAPGFSTARFELDMTADKAELTRVDVTLYPPERSSPSRP